MWYYETEHKCEKYGTSPIPNAHWKFEPNDQPERSKREDYPIVGRKFRKLEADKVTFPLDRCGALNTQETE